MTEKKKSTTDQKKERLQGEEKVDISRHFPDDLPYFENRVKADGKLAFDFFFFFAFFIFSSQHSLLFFCHRFFPALFLLLFSFWSTCLKRPLSVSGLIKFYRHKRKKRENRRDEDRWWKESGGK